MINNKYLKLMLLALILAILSFGCSKKSNEEIKELTIALENGEEQDRKAIETIINGFRDSHKNYNINVINEENLSLIKDEISEKNYDIIISSRTSFLDLYEKGITKDLTSYFNQNKVDGNFYNIVYNYGNVGGKFFGMGMFPYSIEFVYNKNILPNELNNINDLESLENYMKNTDLKIMVILEGKVDFNLALSSIIAKSIIKENSLVNIYDSSSEEYLKASDLNKMFELVNIMVKNYGISKDRFVVGDKDDLKEVDSGEYLLALITSRVGRNNDYNNLECLSGINLDKYNAIPPILVDYIVYSTSSSKKLEEINKFFDYLINDETYIPIAKEGIITGNKKSDALIKGLSSELLWTVSDGNINSIPYYLDLPKKFIDPLINTLDKVINEGEYNGNEWSDIINEAFK